jgi:hypothetical protein
MTTMTDTTKDTLQEIIEERAALMLERMRLQRRLSEATDENAELRGLNAELLAACEAGVPWVCVMTAKGDPYRHPQSIENAERDLAIILAAIDHNKGVL